MRAWLPAAMLLVLAALTGGCQTSQVMTATGGTRLQARDVVRLVYGQAGEPGSGNLTYFAGDITPVVRRMTQRFPELRSALEAGWIGMTADAFLAWREGAVPGEALDGLLDGENRDRRVLYAASAMEAGHGPGSKFVDWLPFEHETFAGEWLAQAPAGWWYRDAKGTWQRKAPPAPEAAK